MQGHKPDLIVSSPANRALSTARTIAKELGYDDADIVTDEAMYFGSMQDVLEGLDDSYNKVMVVGHNPTMTYHMNSLANASVDNMPTCSVAVIGFEIASWADLYSTGGELLEYDYPKSVLRK